MKKIQIQFLFLFLISLSVNVSCQSDSGVVVSYVPAPAGFTDFYFSAESNPSLRWDVQPTLGPSVISGRVPYGTRSALAPTFSMEAGTSVTVNGVAQESGVTAQDFTQPLQYDLSNAGGSKSYTVTLEQVLIGGGWQNQQLNIPFNAGVVSTYAGDGSAITAGTTLATAQFNGPASLTTDGSSMYVAEFFSHVIRKIDMVSGEVSVLAGQVDVAGSADGVGAAASFNNPGEVELVGNDLYVADYGNHLIRKVDLATGEVFTLAGQVGVTTGVDGVGTAATFNAPISLAYDGKDLFVSEFFGQRIRKIDLATNEVSLLAGSGTFAQVDGVGAAASFMDPIALATDGVNLYVGTDSGFKIRKVVIATGAVTSIAGSGVAGSVDGIGAAAQIAGAVGGMALDRDYLYFLDAAKLRKMNLATFEVISLAGNGVNGFADGVGTAAQFDQAMGLAGDETALYVAGFADYRIRKVTR